MGSISISSSSVGIVVRLQRIIAFRRQTMQIYSRSRSTRNIQVLRMALFVLTWLAPFSLLGQNERKGHGMEHHTGTAYRTIQVDGLSIFYREAGPKNAPTIL